MLIWFLCPRSFSFDLNVKKERKDKEKKPPQNKVLLIDSKSDSDPVKPTFLVPVSLMQQ